MVSKLYFRLLPALVLLIVINAVNGLISGLFAGNFIGETALSAVGLYSPVGLFVGAVGTLFLGGAMVLAGKQMGRHQIERMNSIFSLDIIFMTVLALLVSFVLLMAGVLDKTAFITSDTVVRSAFNQYLIGQSVGILPLLLGQQFFSFLTMELQRRRTMIATISMIAANTLLDVLFICVMKMGVLGLALAGSMADWLFLIILVQHYFTDKAIFTFGLKGLQIKDLGDMVRIGSPGALLSGYQVIRGLICNALVLKYVGAVGLSAFAASNAVLGIVWAVPGGMQSAARTLYSVYAGEEDRESLKDVMRTVLYKCIPLMCAIAAAVILLAVPLTRFFYRDPSAPVYQMTVNAFRILPLCMPLAVCTQSFVSYGLTAGKQKIVQIDTIFDGFICVCGFTALLIGSMGMNALFTANVLNGVVTILIFVIYAWIKAKRFPRNMDELMAIPADFGVGEEDRLAITVCSMEDVIQTSQVVQDFCLAHGVNDKQAYYAALCMEEMAGNIVEHGFSKDHSDHRADVRVIYKEGALTLRIKDDCIPFDPAERKKIVTPEDPCKNIGIRMVYQLAEEVDYQRALGLNVLTIKT